MGRGFLDCFFSLCKERKRVEGVKFAEDKGVHDDLLIAVTHAAKEIKDKAQQNADQIQLRKSGDFR